MTQQTINVGSTANDRKGDSLRAAFQKVNANFTELYTDKTDLSYTQDIVASIETKIDGSYTATTSSDWDGTAPTTIASAIDRLAAAVKALNGTGA